MKKLILSAIVMAFAVAVQAGDTKAAKESKDQAPCCAAKASTTQTNGTCTMAKGKGTCSGMACKEGHSKQALLSPKAAAEVGR